jgi:hypothetical protein
LILERRWMRGSSPRMTKIRRDARISFVMPREGGASSRWGIAFLRQRLDRPPTRAMTAEGGRQRRGWPGQARP